MFEASVPRPLQLSITSVAPGGDGVAHVEIDGERRAVFVPHCAEGDVVRAEVDAGKRPARGRLMEVVTPGPDRVAPACPWASRCGGCDWMHLSSKAQARLHVEHLRAALPPAWRDVAIASHPPASPLAYRTRARVHVRCERGRIEVGMNEARTHDPVVVDRCAVLEPAVEKARGNLAGLFAGCRGNGDVQIALGSNGRPVLEIRWDGEVASACFGLLEKAVASGELAGARVTGGEASRPAVVGDPTPWIRGVDGEPLRLAPGGFAQASESANLALVTYVGELASAPRPDRVVELHAGSGNLSVMLARTATDLVTVESSREACDAARANLKARSLAARVVEGDADVYAWSPATRLLVLDPPRTGARAVVERLATSRVARVIYVSCDAQTLGRDLAILSTAYEPRSLAVFEMFPQTSHVETVVELARARGRREERP
jgi:23S rRNA (uracil1939-C5)-methyltransferase